jgi:MYXO-CTERM domain-containing protein
VYWQLAATTTAAQIGAAGFFTGSGTAGTNASKTAIFQVGEAIPEPSAALLGALGVLGLLRRRRI